MKRTIVAICANTTPLRYVTTTHNRADRSIAVELSDDKNYAHDFVNEENANRIIKKLFNPWNRIYTAISVEVNRSAAVVVDDFIN